MATGLIEGERAVEPPGHDRCDRDRGKAHQQRARLIAHQDGEDAEIGDETERADTDEAQRARQALRQSAKRIMRDARVQPGIADTHTQTLLNTRTRALTSLWSKVLAG